MTLREFVLSYQKDGVIVANLFDYYEIFIKTLDNRFKNYSYSHGLVPCYFKDHEDPNPSMGFVNDRRNKGGKLCHCFGCGRTADVVRLHQILRQQYFNRRLEEDEACYELIEMFHLPIEEFDSGSEDDYEKKYVRQVRDVMRLTKHYTVRDFSDTLLKIRMSGSVDLNKVNSECVKMIATTKQLYD